MTPKPPPWRPITPAPASEPERLRARQIQRDLGATLVCPGCGERRTVEWFDDAEGSVRYPRCEPCRRQIAAESGLNSAAAARGRRR